MADNKKKNGMADNKKKNGVVVKSNVKPKKKKNCCCSCLVTMLVVFVIVIGGGVGVGWYFGDQYTKANLDMSLSDVLGVGKDILTAKEKKIVTNSHSNTNHTEFENSLKKQLLLKPAAPLNTDTLLSMILGGDSSTAQSEDTINSPLAKALNENNNNSSDIESNALFDYIATLYSPEYIDTDALEDYDAANHSNYILSFTDKQLAAFLSNIIKTQIDGEQFAEQFSDFEQYLGGKKLSDVVIFDQIIFSGTADSPVIKLTLSIDVRTIAAGYLAELTGYDLGWAVKPLLPKRLFFTAAVNLSDESSLKVYINNTDDAKMERMYKLIRNASKLAGQEMDLEAEIENSVGGVLNSIADSLKNYADLSEIGQGKIKFDLFEMAIGLAQLNEDKPQDKHITSSDIMYTLKYLLTSDFDEAIKTKYTWKDQYIKTGDVETTYKPTNINEYTLVDYEQELLNEIADKYLIDITNGTPDDTTDDKTFADLMALFGMGGEGSGDLMDWIAAERLGELSQRDIAELKVKINDRMLGAMFNAQIASIAGGAGEMSALSPTVYQTIITKTDEKIFLEAGIALDLSQMLGNDMLNLLSGVLPTKAMISFKMEITPNVADDYEFAKSSIMFNNLTADETEWLLSTISKLGVSLSIDDLLSPLEGSMRDVIKTMKEQMPGLEFETSAIHMADLFSLTYELVINTGEEPIVYNVVDNSGNKTGEAEFGATDLQDVIAALYANVDTSSYNPAANNHYGFLEDIIQKYFLSSDKIKVGTEPENYEGDNIYISSFDDLTKIFSMKEFNTDLMNINDLKHTDAEIEELKPIITDSELANIILSMMNGAEFESFSQIASFKIVDKFTIEMVIAIETAALFDGSNNDFSKFIKIDTLYVDVVIHMDEAIEDYETENGDAFRYKTDITINGMSKQHLSKLNALIDHFNSGGDALNLTARAKDIGYYVYSQLDNFKTSMGDKCEFFAGGLEIASIFDVLAESSIGETKPTAENVRIAIQGLWEKTKAADSRYNFVANEIIYNLPVAFTINIPPQSSLDDNELAYALSNGIPAISKMDTAQGVSLAQLNLYSSDMTFENDIWGIEVKDGYDYAEFTFELDGWQTKEDSGEKNNYKEFIPTKIYFTLIFERENAGDNWSSAEVGNANFFRINHLKDEQQNVLLNFANVDTQSFEEQINKCSDILTTLFSGAISYNSTTNTGSIAISLIAP